MDKPENGRNRSKKEKQTTYFHGNRQMESQKEELVKESKDESNRSHSVEVRIGIQVVPMRGIFKYLKSIMQEIEELDDDVTHRIGAYVSCDKNVPLRLKDKSYGMIVRPPILYEAPGNQASEFQGKGTTSSIPPTKESIMGFYAESFPSRNRESMVELMVKDELNKMVNGEMKKMERLIDMDKEYGKVNTDISKLTGTEKVQLVSDLRDHIRHG
ncbi:hypothetical protein H5410_031879 [Solanum commersonii]|uniref:Uncharacterized protein n=1 Tax=Solanum commersonii TaxID=4109 RepID=A0A9J5YKH8_SOLCO|nr:hypothetical protein H5410_031879 [Solanum commersonii]